MKSFIVVCISLFVQYLLFAQNQYPKDAFGVPMNIPLHLSGTFGELRPNHFHSGVDFKTQQKEGIPIVAIADGYVSRIKISPFGYGKAIYIAHPNGYTSVYAHVLKGVDDIESYIKQQQYAQKKFDIELFPSPQELPVRQGQMIALSGNTGSSGGPHLHFEIRDTETENVLNPFLFGYDQYITDNSPPVINTLMAYPLGDQGIVNGSQIPVVVTLHKQKDGSYIAEKVNATVAFGFGINTFDRSDYNFNQNGVYRITMFCNGKNTFDITFNTFSFDESKHINQYLDYEKLHQTRQRFQKLFVENPYGLSLVEGQNGIMASDNNLNYTVRIEVMDFHQNKTVIQIPVHFKNQEVKIPKVIKKSPFYIESAVEQSFAKDGVSVYIPEHTFYENFYMDFGVDQGRLTLHQPVIPAQKNMHISFETQMVSVDLIEKTFIATLRNGKPSYNKTYIKDDFFVMYTRNLGTYMLMQDIKPPTIKPINVSEGKWMSTEKTLRFTITDDLSGIQTYSAFLNNQWILFEYDAKTNTIVHDFSDNIVQEGRNDLKLIVIDNVGNSTIFETHFFRSQK